MPQKKSRNGQIFAMPLPDGTYVHLRIMLDILGAIKRRLLPHDSPLTGVFSDTHLVEVYSTPTPTPDYVPSAVSIPGIFVDPTGVAKRWTLVSEQTVDPQTVVFPEGLIGINHPDCGAAFECGEIKIPVPFTERDLQTMDVYQVRNNAFMLPFIWYRIVGRESDIPEKYRTRYFYSKDQRLSLVRARIYEHLPFSMKQTYFEKQAQLGLHLERLYEK